MLAPRDISHVNLTVGAARPTAGGPLAERRRSCWRPAAGARRTRVSEMRLAAGCATERLPARREVVARRHTRTNMERRELGEPARTSG